jgi:hypothetical protein
MITAEESLGQAEEEAKLAELFCKWVKFPEA